jgi:hypothetical protein
MINFTRCGFTASPPVLRSENNSLFCCSICGAVVTYSTQELHENWHRSLATQIENLADLPERDLSNRCF